MRTTQMLTFAALLLAGTATAASACGSQASLQRTGYTTAATASQDLSAVSKKKITKSEMSRKKMMKRSTTGAPAGVNPAGGPGTGTTPAPKSSSTGNAGTGAGAAGGQGAGAATNNGH
jgi:hypothetical protein